MIKASIPNTITLGNMACGLLAILSITRGDFILAAYLVAAALLFDFLDGLVARALGVHSELGKQLDSLADVVSFGVVPGFFMYKLFRLAQTTGEPVPEFLAYLAFLIPLFSALRLAKFNIDTRQATYFIGMPTPANTLFIFSVGLWAVYGNNSTVQHVLLHPFFLTAITVLCSLLLVAEVPLLSLKLKSFKWKDNRGIYLLLIGVVILLAILRFRALAFVIPLYLILSLIFKPESK